MFFLRVSSRVFAVNLTIKKMEYKDLLKKYTGHFFITGISTRPNSIVLPFYHSIIPLVPVDKYGLSRHWQSRFPTLFLLYPFPPKSSRSLAISPPVFLKRMTNITHVSTSSTVYPAPVFRFPVNINLNSPVHLHNGSVMLSQSVQPGNEYGYGAKETMLPLTGEPGAQTTLVFHHAGAESTAPGAKPVSPPATQPAAPGNSNMLILERLKGPTQFHSSRVFSSLALYHFNRDKTLNRGFHLVSNRYFNNRVPGHERSNIVHGSEPAGHRGTKKPGQTNGFGNDIMRQRSKVRIAGNKPGALNLHYLNPRPVGARGAGAPQGNPLPAQTRGYLQHSSVDASQSHDPRPYNRALPGVPGIPQTDKMNIDLDHLTNRLYVMLERKIKIEKEMRGL